MKRALVIFHPDGSIRRCSETSRSGETDLEVVKKHRATDTSPASMVRLLALALAATLASACGSTQSQRKLFVPGERYDRPELHSLTQDKILATYGHEPWAQQGALPRVGLALSGGGSKAAPFAMGVLKAFVDQNWLSETQLLSSVSGGSYAAMYLYDNAAHQPERSLSDAFLDPRDRHVCSQLEYRSPDYSEGGPFGDCCSNLHEPTLRHQWVRCSQDLLSSRESERATSMTNGKKERGATRRLLLATLASLPIHHLARTLFDANVQISPSRHAYVQGIRRSYQYEPETETLYRENARLANLRPLDEIATSFPFVDLASAKGLPYWIINATNNIGWSRGNNVARNQFEVSAFGYGSEEMGYVVGDPAEIGMSVPVAVSASAAFLNAQVARWRPWKRFLIHAGLHLVNVDWSVEVKNYNRSDRYQAFHQVLPFPLHTYRFFLGRRGPRIRLSDGGSSGDNLGMLPLLVRGTQAIVVASAAQDGKGATGKKTPKNMRLKDLCRLDKFLNSIAAAQNGGLTGFTMVFDGLPSSTHDTTSFPLNEQCSLLDDGDGISPYEWRRTVWDGRICPILGGRANCGAWSQFPDHPWQSTRIYFLKSGIDRNRLDDESDLTDTCYLNSDPCRQESKKPKHTCERGFVDDTLREYPCMLRRFWVMNNPTDKQTGRSSTRTTFPQNGTVAMTRNSSQYLYSAYVDLANYLALHLEFHGLFGDPKNDESSEVSR